MPVQNLGNVDVIEGEEGADLERDVGVHYEPVHNLQKGDGEIESAEAGTTTQ